MKLKIIHVKQKHPLFRLSTMMLFFIMFAASLFAQERSVTGKITDKSGAPLPGVSITLKGTGTGTISDIDGNFNIKVPDNNAVIEAKIVGYETKEIAVGEMTQVSIVLEESFTEIDQVVVIGYGTMKKSDLTGSIASVSAEDIAATPVARIDEALTGRAAGVNVSATSGMPGADRAIQIRGISSINGFAPLVVIDGIPGGDMNRISPSDIESIEVLKDAASASIYGATGGNGVILITTKKGKEGKIGVSANLYTGIQELPYKIPMMNTDQWIQMYAAMNDELFEFGEFDENTNTDWQDEVYESAPIRNIDINMSGGTELSKFSFGINYLTQDGLVKNTGYEKFLVSLSSSYKVSKRIRFDEIIRFSYDNIIGPSQWQYQNVYNNFTTMPALMMPPFLEPYDENGTWTVSPVGGANPFVGIDARSNQTIKNLVIHGNFGLSIDLVKGLTFTSRLAGTANNSELWSFMPEYFSWANDFNPLDELTQDWGKSYTWTFQNYLTYDFTLAERHNFTFLLAMEAARWWDYNMNGFRQDYSSTNPDLLYFDNSLDENTPSQIVGGSGKEKRSAGYFGRVNYNFNDLLLIQGNIRRDGDSNFGPNNKWGTFYSGSAGFKFSELQVIKDMSFLSFGKVRVSYGESGQFPITTYWPYASTVLNAAVMNYSYDDETVITGRGPVQIPNSDLKWETVSMLNFGLDLGFFKDQLMVTVEYFSKLNDGMIMPQEVPSVAGTYLLVAGSQPAEVGTTGITSTYPLVNFGSVKNNGLETTINYKKRLGEVNIDAGLNFTYMKNEITELATDSTFQGSVHDLNGLTINKIGYPIGTYRGWVFDGLFEEGDRMVYNSAEDAYVFADQPYSITDGGDTIYARPEAEPGDAKWVDINGDGRWDAGDRTYLGSYIPKYVFGFNFGVEYKGIDVSMFVQGVAGNEIFNGVKRWTYNWQNQSNKEASFADRYHLPVVIDGETIDPGNLDSDLPDYGGQNWGTPSNLYIENGSYLRLRNLTVGYTLPNAWTSKIGISRFRLYFIGKNLLTLTAYEGYDPEVSSTDPKTAGIDVSGYPQSKVYTFGINLEF
jgi:TonB-dependent starch-binding outer membrane protein SusC